MDLIVKQNEKMSNDILNLNNEIINLNTDINELKDTGRTVLYAEGTLEEFIDTDERSHREFLDWYNNN